METTQPSLSPDERRTLLRLARETAEEEWYRRALQPVASFRERRSTASTTPKIDGRFGGVFVTFWAGKALRGCIGTLTSTDDLVQTVQQATCSALADPRFEGDPITLAELPQLEIEISILSDATPTSNPLSLIPGVHGIVVRQGERSGCFLPKVAADRGWSAEEFLSNCCTMKAGLPPDAWRQGDTQVLLFTAEAFRESRLG